MFTQIIIWLNIVTMYRFHHAGMREKFDNNGYLQFVLVKRVIIKENNYARFIWPKERTWAGVTVHCLVIKNINNSVVAFLCYSIWALDIPDLYIIY